MSDPVPLLVPMQLQALLANEALLNDPDQKFERWTNDYSQLQVFEDPVPQAFKSLQQNPPAKGVHLLWKLPASLTHGRAKDTAPIAFDCIPNRWVVVRLATPPGGADGPGATAWIIESDYLDPATGSNDFADPTSTPGNIRLTKLGRNLPIAQWTEPAGGPPMFLRPTGAGDVTFTAFQAGLFDVLAFHDDTTGLPEDTALTYLVAGWYSDPAHDPLANYALADLQWSVLGNAGAAPTLSVVHGMTYGLVWQNNTVPPRIDADATSMQVAVGYSAIDALAAIVAANATDDVDGRLETKLQAFQYGCLNLLDDPDGSAQLELRIRDAWFGATAGGTRWSLVPVSQGQADQSQLARAAEPAAPPLSAAQAAWLAALNVRQRQYDQANRDLRTQQWELFALWWKGQHGITNPGGFRTEFYLDPDQIEAMVAAQLDTADPTSFAAGVIAAKAQVDALAAQLPDPTSETSLDTWSGQVPGYTLTGRQDGTITPAFRLRPSALPPFHQPADPVVLIAGLTPPANEAPFGVDLPCRTPDAAVTGVEVQQQAVSADTGSLAAIMPALPTAALPAGVKTAVDALLVETFFADPGNAGAIVKHGLGSGDGGLVTALATAMTAGAAQLATIPNPLGASFAFAPWRQAWAPLFLQWDITWFPTVAVAKAGDSLPAAALQYPAGDGGEVDNWPFLPDAWAFDGGDGVSARGSEYYRYTGAAPAQPSHDYIGRTFLTPQATQLLIKRLEDYIQVHSGDPDLTAIQNLIDAVGETRFLSQALSGFNAAFIMRALTQVPSPDPGSPLGQAIAGEHRGVPRVDLGDQDCDGDSGIPFFFPVRGGAFQFARLVIVDAFGQVLDLLAANANKGLPPDAADFCPIRAAGLVPDAAAGSTPSRQLIKQAPRIVQPSRLNLRLLDAASDSKELYYTPDVNPLCGWLLPNHLDRSIAAYDAAGNPLGELLVLAQSSGEQDVRWLAAPDVVAPIADPSQIANPHLAAILGAFTAGSGGIAGNAAARVAAFQALYASIDETLWMVDPPGGQSDHDLAALIGRPIAVVRAQLQFELYGAPAVNQSWRDTLAKQDAGLTGFDFPIRLGSVELLDDGLIGYFTSDDYTAFNAVHPSTASTSPYVAPVVPDNYLQLKFDYPDYSALNLTLLMDPRAHVHATTGLLPTATLQLPAEYYRGALARMAVTFRAGPVLSRPGTVRIPAPAEQNGAWTWVRRLGTGNTPADWEIDPIVGANAKARLPDQPPHLLDGWLKFTPSGGLAAKADED